MRILAVIIIALLAGAAALLWARSQFMSSLRQRAESIERSEPVELEGFDRLPPVVRDYLHQSGLEAGQTYRYFHLEQTGEMKLSEDGDWQPFSAEQWFSVSRPAFLWKPEMPMPVGSITGADWLDGGEGGLQMRLLGAIPVANAEGPEVAEGQLARYLAELPWNPAAMVGNERIEWTQDDDRHATARLAVGEVSSSMTFEFDERGDLAGVLGERPRGTGDELERLRWGGEFSEYAEFDGVRVPTRGEVFWEQPNGRFTYWRGDIVGFEWR